MARSESSGRGPVIIVSVGRSGSTLLHGLLASYPKFAWMSALVEWFPQTPILNRAAMSAIDVPLLGPRIRSHVNPFECYGFWRLHMPGFSEPPRDLTAADVHEPFAMRTRAALAKLQTKQRNRLLLKVTGWPRVGFLDELLPGASFLHVVRDPRAVVASLLQVPWWDGYEGPNRWRYGPLTDEDTLDWGRCDQSWPALAALQWRAQIRAAEDGLNALPGSRVVRLRYEDLVDDPHGAISQISSDLGLDWGDSGVPSFSGIIGNRSNAWRHTLGERDLADIRHLVEIDAASFGYDLRDGVQ
jgi:hypothetical protein